MLQFVVNTIFSPKLLKSILHGQQNNIKKMKKIHFDNYEKSNYWNSLIIFALIFILIGIFEPFQVENSKIRSDISITILWCLRTRILVRIRPVGPEK